FQKKIGLEDRVEVGRWLITKTDEPNVLQAATLSGEQLFLIEGKQYNSIEGLEVLSLFQDSGELKDLTLKKLVSTIIEKKGLPVIPWAFGKWIGKRGQILKSLLLQLPAQRRLFLGDNGGRPSCYVPKPLLNTNFKKLPGSDPLPLENEEKRIGAFGAHIDEAPDYTGIGKQLLTLLQQDVVQISPYGRGLSLPRFLINQFQIRR
ncbi:MAG: hypothetical protein GY705_10170, partial [Bacteroidetes bacterium]|nr:hypothetical protein [Bacteroidota bacterium]